MSNITLRASSAFGLESIVSYELRDLGFTEQQVSNGYIDYTAQESDILRSNLWLRCSDRVLWVLKSFDCENFDHLFEAVSTYPWGDMLPQNAAVNVKFKTYKSLINSATHGQAVTKKAVIESLKKKYRVETFPENGPRYNLEVSVRNNRADLCLNTSGAGLHKRGYRQGQGDAPLKETLAAAMVKLSRWSTERPMADPFCGSGTIAIEAALIGRNKAPGLLREFACEQWPHLSEETFRQSREHAQSAVTDAHLDIYASDIDTRVFKKAVQNAESAGVADTILFEKKDVSEFQSKKKYGCIVTNPPYGERMNDKHEAAELYKKLGTAYRELDEWSAFILTTGRNFEKDFGSRSDKNRKLYNGTIQCYLYQYFGKMK